MIGFAPGTRVFLACQPVDLRNGFDGLASLVAARLAADPYGGQMFVFRGKRGDRLKVLYWDGTGLVLLAKRLEQGRFAWPPITVGGIVLSAAQLALLLDGMDWRRIVLPIPPQRPVSSG